MGTKQESLCWTGYQCSIGVPLVVRAWRLLNPSRVYRKKLSGACCVGMNEDEGLTLFRHACGRYSPQMIVRYNSVMESLFIRNKFILGSGLSKAPRQWNLHLLWAYLGCSQAASQITTSEKEKKYIEFKMNKCIGVIISKLYLVCIITYMLAGILQKQWKNIIKSYLEKQERKNESEKFHVLLCQLGVQ